MLHVDPMQQSPPVAIRIVRPYASEAEFLEGEGETITRSGVMLVGATHRPQGVILRFEVTLTGGQTLLRGEGRVTGFKERAFGDQAGLVLRFTRLDPKSKAFIDRATGGAAPSSTRAPESTPLLVAADPADPAPSQRALPPSGKAPTVSPPAPAEPPPAPSVSRSPVPASVEAHTEPDASADATLVARPAVAPGTPPPPAPPPAAIAPLPPPPPAPEARREASELPTRPTGAVVARNRDDLLQRLRSRHARMTSDQVSHILARLV